MDQTLKISPDLGFIQLPTASVSSKVFEKDGYIYKINSRNSLERTWSDYKTLKAVFSDIDHHIVHSEIFDCIFEGKRFSCVKQEKLIGFELAKMSEEQIKSILADERHPQSNIDFLKELTTLFFTSIQNKQLYPDIVGFPSNPTLFNSINLIYEPATGYIKLCDVGLSPHEDTLNLHGDSFFESDNVKLYLEKIKESVEGIEVLKK